jgi:hypothetical protein
MINWLTKLYNRVRYGKLVTEDYTGKVVLVSWVASVWNGESAYKTEFGTTLITVLWDDGSRFIAGPMVLPEDWVPVDFLSSEDGLHHACKGRVTVVADSLADCKEAIRIKRTRERWQANVCSNEAGVVGIVTDYDGVTFYGKSLEGSAWEAKDMKPLAENYQKYCEGRAEKI